jgi:hypothetical protein
MKLVLVALSILFIQSLEAQSLKKYPISNSGCSLYLYCDPKKFDFDYSEDSSKVYTSECLSNDVTYGVICIQLLRSLSDLEAAEELMISYVDFLKADFNVRTAAGYGKGHRLNQDENTRGIIDYWKDGEERNWKIKAWTNGKYIGVLYANSAKELPEARVNVFLDGFRFPS